MTQDLDHRPNLLRPALRSRPLHLGPLWTFSNRYGLLFMAYTSGCLRLLTNPSSPSPFFAFFWMYSLIRYTHISLPAKGNRARDHRHRLLSQHPTPSSFCGLIPPLLLLPRVKASQKNVDRPHNKVILLTFYMTCHD